MAKNPPFNFIRHTSHDKKFSITAPGQWTKVKSKASGGNKILSFVINEDHAFQVSTTKVADHHEEIIKANGLKPQGSNRGELEFVEKYHKERGGIAMYMWVCLVDNQILLATYTLPAKLKRPTATPIVRMALKTLRFHGTTQVAEKPEVAAPTPEPFNIEDISHWKSMPSRFFDVMSKKKGSRANLKFVEFKDIDILNLYSLLKVTVAPEPNGFHSIVREGFPMDNMIWWDFLFECPKGFVHIWRTANLVEAMYSVDVKGFDLASFLQDNIKRHITKIQAVKKTYTKYISYVNQYRSYKDCVDHLWKEVSTIDVSAPEIPLGHREPADAQNYGKTIRNFIERSIRFHALGKSLVLNAAFEIESFLNLVIRVGATEELKKYPDVMNKHLTSPFNDRLKNIKFYSQVLTKDVDPGHSAIKDAKLLMTLRNKYVHFDESSEHNRLGNVYFDHDFPLHEISKYRPSIEAFKQLFHTVDMKTIKKAYDTANNFVTYLGSLFTPGLKDHLNHLLEQNPIGYNTVRQTYAVIYKEFVIEFMVGVKPRKRAMRKSKAAKKAKAPRKKK